MDRDEVFVPRTLEQRKPIEKPVKVTVEGGIDLDELLEDAPLYRLVTLIGQQVRSETLSCSHLHDSSLSFVSHSSSDGRFTSS